MRDFSLKASRVKESSTLAITAKAKKMKAEGIDLVSFGAGEPDFPTPDFVNQAAIEAINSGFTKYTAAAGIDELRKAIAKKLKDDNGLDYDYKQIVVSNGAKHSLTNIFTSILNDGDEVIIPSPYWLSYKQIVEIAGGVAVIVETSADTSYKITGAMLEKNLRPKTKALIINSPSNPTGMVYSREELQMIADFAVKNDLFVISDEIYECLIYDQGVKHISIASLGGEIKKRTIVVNGLSKSHSMPGWRVGYTASCPELAQIMANVQSHQASNPNSIAQKGALAAFTHDKSCVEDMKKEYVKRRDYIYERAQNIPGFKQLKPQGAFYLFCDVSSFKGKSAMGRTVNDGADLAAMLLEGAKVSVIPCTDFGFPDALRLSYCMGLADIKKGMDRIEEFISQNF